jgi:trigger factor
MSNSMNFLPVPEVKYSQKSPILGEFEVNVHSAVVKEKLHDAYSRLQKRVTLPGFRAGKVPLDLVKKKYQGEVLNDVFNQLVNETYRKGATENKVRVAGDPYITKTNIGEWKEGETLNYTAQVDLIPEVELKKYKGLPIKKKEGSIGDEDIEVVIKNLLDPKAELENLPAETPVAKGMLAVIDFEGKLDGKVLEDASAKNFFLEVGAPNSLEDFQNGLLGMKAGDEKTIPVKYPEDYKNTDVAGKEVIYTVKLHEVKQKKYPELTDELAKEFQAENVADLRQKVRGSLEAEMENEQRQQSQEEALLALVEQNDFEVPPSLVQRQLQYILQEVAGLLRKQQFGDNLIQDYLRKHSKDFEARAAREVKLALLLPKVVEAEKIAIGDEDLKKHYEEIVKQSGQKMDAVEKFYNGSPQHKEDLTRELERRKALDALVSNAKAV